MRLLITGSTGFVGKHLVDTMLANYSYEIALLVRDVNKASKLFCTDDRITYIDLQNKNYKQEIKNFNPKAVIHLASYLTSDDSQESINNILSANIELGTNVLDSLYDTDVEYFINFGTSTEYYNNDGELNSPYLYSATKTAFRSIIKYYQNKLHFKWINVVPYTIYGGIDSQKKVIDFIISSIDVEQPVKMSKGEQVLDFIHIDDVTSFVLTLIEKINLREFDALEGDYVEFKLGTGVGTSIRSVAEIVEEVFNKKTNIAWGSLPYREMDIMLATADITNNEKFLNWECKVDLKSGIEKMKNEVYYDK